MKPWEISTWKFPDAGEHPAVVLGTEERVRLKPRVCVLLCSTQRAARAAELHEVILDTADGLEWEILCKCDVVYAAPKSELVKRRGIVTAERRRAIAERVIRSLGLGRTVIRLRARMGRNHQVAFQHLSQSPTGHDIGDATILLYARHNYFGYQ